MDVLTQLVTPALLALVAAAVLLVVFNDWRVTMPALALQYGSAAVLIAQIPVMWQIVLVKLLVGALVVSILVITGRQVNFSRPASTGNAAVGRFFPTNFPFRLMAVLMAVVAAWYTASQPQFALPGLQASPAINLAAYVLLALGLLNLGLTEEPLNGGLGLLTLLTGFEVFYAALESSLAVVALLAAVQFGVALAVSYLALVHYGASAEVARE